MQTFLARIITKCLPGRANFAETRDRRNPDPSTHTSRVISSSEVFAFLWPAVSGEWTGAACWAVQCHFWQL